MADNLNLPQVAASQDQKEVTINDAIDQLSGALTDFLAVSMTGGTASLTDIQFQSYMGFTCSGTSSPSTLTVPDIRRALFYVTNNNTADMYVTVGTTLYVLDEGDTGLFQTDGTANGLLNLVPATASGGTEAASGVVAFSGISINGSGTDS